MNFQLSDEQLNELEQGINSSEHPEVRQRAIAIRLLGLGYHPEKVAEMGMVKSNTVWTWHRRYRAQGIAGLQDQPRSGRPRKGTREYCWSLEPALKTDPAKYGYSFTVWTAERLRDHLEKETGICLSIGRFTELLEREGFVYRRSKPDLMVKQDQAAKSKPPRCSTS
ncbi:MAG: transposase [Anaerolineae bacterium]|nr:transposase [Anaerolineae bacterium]